MKRKTSMGDLFPTADEVVLAMRGYFQKLGESASMIYEVPDMRFDVVDEGQVLELAMPNPKGDYIGVIVDVLGLFHGKCDVEQFRRQSHALEQL